MSLLINILKAVKATHSLLITLWKLWISSGKLCGIFGDRFFCVWIFLLLWLNNELFAEKACKNIFSAVK